MMSSGNSASIAIVVMASITSIRKIDGFHPSISINSCSKTRLEITLTNAVSGGVVYIQGTGSGCRHVTFSGSNVYNFNLSTCNVNWERTFRVVIQKTPEYHTIEDKTFPVSCTTDLSSINVEANFDTAPGREEAPILIRTKPSAEMTLTLNRRSVIGTTVQLGDPITIDVELLPQFRDDFDIRVLTCTIFALSVITEGCSVDPDIFPSFSKISTGHQTTTFNAFIPTDQTGRPTRTVLSCTLDICLNRCSKVICSNRYRSRAIGGTTSNLSHGKFYVNSTVLVSDDNNTPSEMHKEDVICIQEGVIVVLIVITFVFIALSIYLCLKIRSQRKMIKQQPYVKNNDKFNHSLKIGQDLVEERSYQYCHGQTDESSSLQTSTYSADSVEFAADDECSVQFV